eukprot:PhM_4_TR9279/c0_g1_i1/m.81341
MDTIARRPHPRVLLVGTESREFIRAVACLTKLGCIVQEALGVKAALSMWRYPRFHDIIISEFNFKHGNAVDLAAEIRVNERSHDEKSIIVGIYTSAQERADMEKSDNFDLLMFAPLETHEDFFRNTLVLDNHREVLCEEAHFNDIEQLLAAERRMTAFMGLSRQSLLSSSEFSGSPTKPPFDAAPTPSTIPAGAVESSPTHFTLKGHGSVSFSFDDVAALPQPQPQGALRKGPRVGAPGASNPSAVPGGLPRFELTRQLHVSEKEVRRLERQGETLHRAYRSLRRAFDLALGVLQAHECARMAEEDAPSLVGHLRDTLHREDEEKEEHEEEIRVVTSD